MALEASHIRFALDIKDKLGVIDLDKYISGSIYPDSRYVTGIERQLTHPKELLEKDIGKLSDFEKGWYTHLLYDKILKSYTTTALASLFADIGNTEVINMELWIRLTSLKILQDIDDIKKYDIKIYLPYLDYVQNANGEDINKLLNYNHYFQNMYAIPKQVSVESYYDMWRFLGVDSNFVRGIQKQTEIYQKNLRLHEFISTVYRKSQLHFNSISS